MDIRENYPKQPKPSGSYRHEAGAGGEIFLLEMN
jgi:hypothetical protein